MRGSFFVVNSCEMSIFGNVEAKHRKENPYVLSENWYWNAAGELSKHLQDLFVFTGWFAANFDALPPLTEWDSRSLQQKMVGGFSSQSRWIHSCVWADPWLVELRAFAFRSAVSINRCIESCTAQSRLHVCRWFNNLSLCRKKRLGTHPPVKEFHWPHASGDAITQQCRGRRRFPLKL